MDRKGRGMNVRGIKPKLAGETPALPGGSWFNEQFKRNWDHRARSMFAVPHPFTPNCICPNPISDYL
jgi:hypothetical protein